MTKFSFSVPLLKYLSQSEALLHIYNKKSNHFYLFTVTIIETSELTQTQGLIHRTDLYQRDKIEDK